MTLSAIYFTKTKDVFEIDIVLTNMCFTDAARLSVLQRKITNNAAYKQI